MRVRRVRGVLLLVLCFAGRTAAVAPPAGKLFGVAPEEFAQRRAAIRAGAPDAIVLLRAPSAEGDMDRMRFRTENNLMYLTGVEAPGAYLALLPEGDPSGKREILFLPPQFPGARVWMDPVPGPGPETERDTGFESVQSARSMWETLKPSLLKAKKVHLNGPAGERARYTPNGAMEARIREINPAIEITGTAGSLIHPLRWRKSPGEIANLRAAIAATGEGQRNAAKTIRPGATELAVEGAIIAGFRKGGAPREGFPCIVGSGPNSTVLHHFSGERKMQAGETVVVDIGAEYNYYSADITRTYPVGGKFTPRQRRLYQLVLDTQRVCAKYVQPGKTTLGELHRFAQDYLRNSPLRARDARGNERTMDAFFAHGLGHWLGMDVHDVGGRSSVLEPGVVFTIEPGVYIPSEGIGIRIEDDYLVTENGLEKLSKDIPSEIAQIEALMRDAPPKTPPRRRGSRSRRAWRPHLRG